MQEVNSVQDQFWQASQSLTLENSTSRNSTLCKPTFRIVNLLLSQPTSKSTYWHIRPNVRRCASLPSEGHNSRNQNRVAVDPLHHCKSAISFINLYCPVIWIEQADPPSQPTACHVNIHESSFSAMNPYLL